MSSLRYTHICEISRTLSSSIISKAPLSALTLSVISIAAAAFVLIMIAKLARHVILKRSFKPVTPIQPSTDPKSAPTPAFPLATISASASQASTPTASADASSAPASQASSPAPSASASSASASASIFANSKPPTEYLPGTGRSYPVYTGLYNPGQMMNTCWLNSTLKLIAATDYFDDLFTIQRTDDLEPLRLALHTIISALRSNSKKPEPPSADLELVEWKLFENLGNEVNKNFGNIVNGEFQDAEQFLWDLLHKFKFKPKDTNHFEEISTYKSKDDQTLPPKVNTDWNLQLQIQQNEQSPLRVLMRDREPTFKPENIEYTVTKTLTRAPNNLLIPK